MSVGDNCKCLSLDMFWQMSQLSHCTSHPLDIGGGYTNYWISWIDSIGADAFRMLPYAVKRDIIIVLHGRHDRRRFRVSR